MHSLPEECLKLEKFRFQESHLSQEFAILPESDIAALNTLRQRPLQVQVTVLDEVGKKVTRPDYSQPMLKPSYRIRSLPFSAAGWAEQLLGMKSSKSEKKCPVFVQITLS